MGVEVTYPGHASFLPHAKLHDHSAHQHSGLRHYCPLRLHWTEGKHGLRIQDQTPAPLCSLPALPQMSDSDHR